MAKFTPAVQELENTFAKRQTGPFVDRGGSVGFDVRAYGAVLDGTTNDGNALVNAITAAQASGIKVVTVAGGTALVGSALTVPAGVTLRVPEGAKIKPANGVTLTINGAFEAGLYQVFDTSAGGTIAFGPGAVERVLPQWWGAQGDGATDATAAVQAAIDALTEGVVQITKGIVYNRSSLTLKPKVLIVDESKALQQVTGVRPFVAPMTGLEIIAHRGFSYLAPENTLAAITAAIEYGAHSVEFDVSFSSDGEPVIIHDDTLDRTTDGTGKVVDHTLAELRALDAGSWFSTQFTGAKIPTLAEALDVCRGRVRWIYPEIKNYRPGQGETDVATMVQTIIDAGFEDSCVIHSFGHVDVNRVRKLSSRIVLGYTVHDLSGYRTALDLAEKDGNAVIISNYTVITANPTIVEESRKRGVDVVVWVVDRTDIVRQLLRLGVTRIETNRLMGMNI